MKKENKPAGSLQKSLLFLVPLAVTTAAAAIGIASLKPVPTELPEKLAYAEPTVAPMETEAPEATPELGAETTEAPSAEPSEAPETETEPPATEEPSGAPETQSPEESTAPETTPAQQSAAPTAGATATPKPTSTPAVTQGPNNPNAPTSAPTATPTAKPTTAPVTTAPVTATPTTPPTAAPTAAPTEAPGRYKDGSYTASARCTDNGMFDYTVEVTVVVSGGDITSFNAVRKDDLSAPGIPDMNAVFMENALGSIRSEILREQSADSIDVVSGATYSSRSIIEAAKTALARASKSVSGIIEPTVLPDRRSHFFKAHSEESEER